MKTTPATTRLNDKRPPIVGRGAGAILARAQRGGQVPRNAPHLRPIDGPPPPRPPAKTDRGREDERDDLYIVENQDPDLYCVAVTSHKGPIMSAQIEAISEAHAALAMYHRVREVLELEGDALSITVESWTLFHAREARAS